MVAGCIMRKRMTKEVDSGEWVLVDKQVLGGVEKSIEIAKYEDGDRVISVRTDARPVGFVTDNRQQEKRQFVGQVKV